MAKPKTTVLRVADLSASGANKFTLDPSPEARAGLQDRLGLEDLRKLRFSGEIVAQGARDWRLQGDLGATVVQPCVATLEPVTTRLDQRVQRLYLADYEMPTGPETEMPEDETHEALGEEIDLELVMEEALALALPLYPRADAAAPVCFQTTEPGRAAMTDEDAKPFAGLAALKAQITPKDPEENG